MIRRGKSNLLVLQGGGPTPVLNTSLAAVIEESLRNTGISRVLGSRHGIEGLCRGDIVDLSNVSSAQLAELRQTPGASLGTTRYVPSPADMEKILSNLSLFNVRYLLLIGGNGSLRGAHAISEAATAVGQDLCVIGVPKTVDNDIAHTDRCPGYGSAARYVAQTVRDLGADVRSLPQPVSILETMGRSTGWLAAASVLAKRDEADAPHLVYLPERPFSLDRFLADIDRTVKRHGWAVAVVNEGIRFADGKIVHEISDASQADACNRPLPGGVARFLAGAVTRSLKIRCRSEKPGLCGRASMLHVSEQDRRDADLVGRVAVRAALVGNARQMICLHPLPCAEGGPEYGFVPLSRAAGKDRVIPKHWLADSDVGVTDEFIQYARRLAGDLLDYGPQLADDAPRANPDLEMKIDVRPARVKKLKTV